MNDKNELTLIVPNLGDNRFQGVHKKIRVEFDQTATHIHHAPDQGITLPASFDMNYSKSLDNPARIIYANKMVPRELVIRYQNELAKKLIPVYNPTTKSYPGFAGKQKRETQLVLTPIDPGVGNQDFYLGLIREDGLHITTYPITKNKLQNIAKDDFWVLQDRDL